MIVEAKIKTEFNAKWLDVDAGVRNWEDGEINGQQDNDIFDNPDLEPTMPFAEKNEDGEWRWRITIDLDNGRIDGWPAGNTASVHYKVCDDGNYRILDNSGNVIIAGESQYVPGFIGEYGDYIVMGIDANGYIEDFDFTQEDFDELAEEYGAYDED